MHEYLKKGLIFVHIQVNLNSMFNLYDMVIYTLQWNHYYYDSLY